MKDNDVYEVEDLEDLGKIRENPEGHFIICKDIEVNGISFGKIESFGGVIDGQGNSIKGILIENWSSAEFGFVGHNHGTIKI